MVRIHHRKKNESVEDYNRAISKLYYGDGYHIKEIAEKLQIDEVNVYNYVSAGHKITTNEDREEMIYLHNMGYSYRAIAEMFGKSISCVKTRIAEPAKFSCQKSEKVTDNQLELMKDMAVNGYTLEDISKVTGIKLSSVRCRLAHTDLRKRLTYITDTEVKKMIKLFKDGKSYSEIAKECNRSKSTVYRQLLIRGYSRKK